MSFRAVVEATPHLEHAWEPGLRALRPKDRGHVQSEDTRKLTGSVDIDSALRDHDADAHRWDFAIGYRHTNRTEECIYWVEVHTATDAEVNVVLDKLRWLREWLASAGNALRGFERDFIWVSSGATSFTLNAPKLKQCAQLGLQHKGRVLRIRNQRSP